jgi:hypothetical protein
MQAIRFSRATASKSLWGAQQRMGAATLASFQTPKVANEPNVSAIGTFIVISMGMAFTIPQTICCLGLDR